MFLFIFFYLLFGPRTGIARRITHAPALLSKGRANALHLGNALKALKNKEKETVARK
jgi:hypothetical protein